MQLIIVLITIASVFTAFFSNLELEKTPGPLVAYFIYQFYFIKNNLFLFILGIIVLIVLFFRIVKFDKKYPLRKKYLFSLIQVSEALVIGIFFSYVVLLCIAFLELNILSLTINHNPKLLGVVTEKAAVVNALKNNNRPPEIIISENKAGRDVLAVATAISGSDNFYGNYLLPGVPGFLVLPVKKMSSSILLIDNTLIVRELSSDDLEKISPTVAHLLLQSYFYDRKIKPAPKVMFMGGEEYLVFRKEDFQKNLTAIEDEYNKLEGQISSASAAVKEYQNKLGKDEDTIKKAIVSRDLEYKKCLANGEYSLSYCKSLLAKWNKIIDPGTNNLEDSKQKLELAKRELQDFENDDKYYTVLRKAVRISENNIPRELGAFNPPNSIKIAFNATESHAIADYFETLIHESLHYISYLSDEEKFSDSFFEESLTEYFARQIIKDDFNFSTNIGYPVYAKIIGQMTKVIPDSDFQDLYFSKDQKGLEEILNRVYGDNFYKNNRTLFLTLQYSTNPAQTLKVANDIMKKIGGERLTEKDLYATKYGENRKQ